MYYTTKDYENNINEQIIKNLATELAKVQFLEVNNIINGCETFEEAYNKLGGFNLDTNNTFAQNELIHVSLQFDFNYKNINGTIFYDLKSKKFEIYEGVSVWVKNFSSPVLYIEDIYELFDFE